MSTLCRRSDDDNKRFFGTHGFVPYGAPNELSDLFALSVSLMVGFLRKDVKTTWPVGIDGSGNSHDNTREHLETMPRQFQPAL